MGLVDLKERFLYFYHNSITWSRLSAKNWIILTHMSFLLFIHYLKMLIKEIYSPISIIPGMFLPKNL
jgi:hypothetical protein